MWQFHLISHSFPVPVSRSLQVSLLASQLTESAAGGKPCGEPAISHNSHHVSLVQWTNLFASRHKGPRFKSTGGYLCETGILLLALSRYSTIIYLGPCGTVPVQYYLFPGEFYCNLFRILWLCPCTIYSTVNCTITCVGSCNSVLALFIPWWAVL
jgi:hypothetical protein